MRRLFFHTFNRWCSLISRNKERSSIFFYVKMFHFYSISYISEHTWKPLYALGSLTVLMASFKTYLRILSSLDFALPNKLDEYSHHNPCFILVTLTTSPWQWPKTIKELRQQQNLTFLGRCWGRFTHCMSSEQDKRQHSNRRESRPIKMFDTVFKNNPITEWYSECVAPFYSFQKIKRFWHLRFWKPNWWPQESFINSGQW